MACALNLEELKSRIENKNAFFPTKLNQEASQTVAFLDSVAKSFTKKDGLYNLAGTSASLSKTVTTEIGKKYDYSGMNDDQKKIALQKAEIGTYIHKAQEIYLTAIINDMRSGVPGSSPSNTEQMQKVRALSFDAVKGLDLGSELNLNEASKKALFEGSTDIVLSILKRQELINVKTKKDGRVEIRMEQIVIDPIKDIGGTADLIAVFSNNTGAIFDFKTKVPKKAYLNTKGELITKDIFTQSDREKYKLQLAELRRILVERYGLKAVSLARIVPIQVNMVWDKTNKQYSNVVSKVAIGDKQNKLLTQIAPLPEKLGFEGFDKFIEGIDARIKKLESAKTEQSRIRIKELQIAKEDIVSRYSFDGTVGHINSLMKIDLDKLSLSELQDHLDELKLLSEIIKDTAEYRETLKKTEKGRELAAEMEESIKNVKLELDDYITSVEFEFYNKRINSLVEQSTGYSLYNDEEQLIPYREESSAGNVFNQLSEFDNPVFKAFRSRLTDYQQNTRDAVEKVIAEVQTKEDAIYNWMKKNGKDQRWLIDSLIDKETDNFVNPLSKEFREGLKKIQGDIKEMQKVYEPSEYWKSTWNDRKQRTKEYFEKRYTREQFVKTYNRWLEENDMSVDASGKPVSETAWLRNKNYLSIKESVRNANLSTEYRNIKSIPELFAYYTMFEDYNKKFRRILGVQYSNLPNNFLPNVRKGMVDRMTEFGAIEGLKSSFNNFIKDFNVRQDDQLFGDVDGNKKSIPKFFINPFKDKSGKLEIGEKSYEFGKSLIIFSKMAYNYQQMSLFEAEALALKDFIENKGVQLITRGGAVVNDFVGNTLKEKLAGTSVANVFNTFINMYIYGVHVEPTLGKKDGKYEKLLLQAKQYFTLKALGLGFIPAAGGYLSATTQSWIEGNKGQIYTKDQYKNAIQLSYKEREKFLSMFAFFDPMNSRQDRFSVTTGGERMIGDSSERGFIKQYVSARTAMAVFSKGDEHIDEVILASMAQNFYITQDGIVKRRKEDEVIDESRTIWNMFKVNDGVVDLGLTPEQTTAARKAFRIAAAAAQSKIKGVIPEEDKAYWQSQIVGQLVMHFKSWMPGLIKERFGNVVYNDALQLVQMGRFRALGIDAANVDGLETMAWLKGIVLPKIGDMLKAIIGIHKYGKRNVRMHYEKWLDKNPGLQDKITYEDYQSAQRAQLRAAAMELRIILIMTTLLMLLRGDWDEDGEPLYKEHYATRKLAALLAKTNSELTFYYNPKEAVNLVRSPIPLVGLLVDTQKLINNTFDESFDTLLGENPDNAFARIVHRPEKNDKTPYLYYTAKMLPVINAGSTFFEVFNEDAGAINK